MLVRFCTKCGVQITDEKRIRRKSPYCSDDCRRESRKELRQLLAAHKCRLCGRTLRQPNPPKMETEGAAPGAQTSLALDQSAP